ncbi:hypothetical protein D9757_012433 [Collybiopsis confluens]|uniref:Uncharacterized protein n=1 Tax=Collybiopsis confluens TaxID=2823264 RepID=A0A8H5CWT6_9AGAR|nr:hypothetical protein D9757_012433 [Collybiopsis confluens]
MNKLKSFLDPSANSSSSATDSTSENMIILPDSDNDLIGHSQGKGKHPTGSNDENTYSELHRENRDGKRTRKDSPNSSEPRELRNRERPEPPAVPTSSTGLTESRTTTKYDTRIHPDKAVRPFDGNNAERKDVDMLRYRSTSPEVNNPTFGINTGFRHFDQESPLQHEHRSLTGQARVLDHQGQRILALEAQLQEARRSLQLGDAQIQELHGRLGQAEGQIHHYQAENSHHRELLEARTREVQGARAFLNATDSYSGEDIVVMVKSLNDEILQASASIADAVEESLECKTERNVSGDWVGHAESRLGKVARRLLQRKATDKGEQIEIMQAALQASLNHSSQIILELWSEHPTHDEALLNNKFPLVEQALVSGTWRSMTRAQTKRSLYYNPSVLFELSGTAKAVIAVAGYYSPEEALPTKISAMIDKKMSAISTSLSKLDEAISEHIISTDMSLIVPFSGAAFDPQMMQDVEGGSSNTQGSVLFVSDMGLVKEDAKASSGTVQSHVLLKAKVYLQGSFGREHTSRRDD